MRPFENLLCAALEFSEDGGRRGHLFADRHARTAAHRQVYVDTRAEADEPVTLTAGPRLTGAHVAENTSRDQPGDLYRRDRLAAGRFDHHRIALVFERGLVDRGIQIG